MIKTNFYKQDKCGSSYMSWYTSLSESWIGSESESRYWSILRSGSVSISGYWFKSYSKSETKMK